MFLSLRGLKIFFVRTPKYTNTCTVDNFLQIILVACHQNSDLPKFFDCSESELALKASMAMLLKGDTFAGKELMLEHLNSMIVHLIVMDLSMPTA